MRRRTVVGATDPRGIRVRLQDDQWARIVAKRPIIEPYRREVLRAVAEPDAIIQSKQRHDAHLYYAVRHLAVGAQEAADRYVVVVVQLDDLSLRKGRVNTAWIGNRPPKGRVLWRRSP